MNHSEGFQAGAAGHPLKNDSSGAPSFRRNLLQCRNNNGDDDNDEYGSFEEGVCQCRRTNGEPCKMKVSTWVMGLWVMSFLCVLLCCFGLCVSFVPTDASNAKGTCL